MEGGSPPTRSCCCCCIEYSCGICGRAPPPACCCRCADRSISACKGHRTRCTHASIATGQFIVAVGVADPNCYSSDVGPVEALTFPGMCLGQRLVDADNSGAASIPNSAHDCPLQRRKYSLLCTERTDSSRVSELLQNVDHDVCRDEDTCFETQLPEGASVPRGRAGLLGKRSCRGALRISTIEM